MADSAETLGPLQTLHWATYSLLSESHLTKNCLGKASEVGSYRQLFTGLDFTYFLSGQQPADEGTTSRNPSAGKSAEEMPILSLLEGRHCLVKHGQVFSGIPFSNVRSYLLFLKQRQALPICRWIPNKLCNKPGISGREVQHFTTLRRPA